MHLIGSLTSPYVRFVRVTLAELGIDHEFDVTGPLGKQKPDDERRINEANPLMKVPVLETGEGRIIDSRVIVEWLLRRHAGPDDFGGRYPESLARENVLSTVYGVLEAGILRFLIDGTHPETDMNAGYMARSLARIERALGWLDGCPDLGEAFGPPEAMLVCALEWLRKRRVYDWSPHRRLVQMHGGFAERPSLAETRIPDAI